MIEELIKNELKTYYTEMIKLRRYMHMYPEVSFNEKKRWFTWYCCTN